MILLAKSNSPLKKGVRGLFPHKVSIIQIQPFEPLVALDTTP